MGYHGELLLGETERVDDRCVYTIFYSFGLPLLPLRSYWGVPSRDELLARTPLRLHINSVLLGFWRLYGWLFALGILILGISYLPYSYETTVRVLFWILLAIYLVSLFMFRRAGRQPAERRRVMQGFIGKAIDPAWLYRADLEQLILSLRPQVEMLGSDAEATHASDCRLPIDYQHAPLVFA